MSCGRPKCRPAALASAATAAPARRSAPAARLRRRHGRRPNAARRRRVGRVHAMLGRDAPLDDRARAIDVPGVGVGLAGDERGAEARHGADDRDAAPADTGSAPKATPAARGETMRCTSTAGGRGRGGRPCSRRYARMRSLNAGPPHGAHAVRARRSGGTNRKLSSWPANECSAPSSSLADERTATSSPAGAELATALRTAATIAGARRTVVEPRPSTAASVARFEPGPLFRRQAVVERIGGHDEPRRHRAARRVPRARARRPCRRRAASSAASAAPRIQRQLRARHSANASGAAPRPRYISTVQTPDIALDRLAAVRAWAGERRERPPPHAAAPRAPARSASVGDSVPMRAAPRRGEAVGQHRQRATRATAPCVPHSAL